MFKNMKPLPKMILIAAFVGGAVFGYSKFGQKPTEIPGVEAVQVEAVVERQEMKPLPQHVAASQPNEVNTVLPPVVHGVPQPVDSPLTQSAGIEALLKLEAKK